MDDIKLVVDPGVDGGTELRVVLLSRIVRNSFGVHVRIHDDVVGELVLCSEFEIELTGGVDEELWLELTGLVLCLCVPLVCGLLSDNSGLLLLFVLHGVVLLASTQVPLEDLLSFILPVEPLLGWTEVHCLLLGLLGS